MQKYCFIWEKVEKEDMIDFLVVFVASVAAGFINAIAGGGTLITFPVLTAIGISPIAANVTNTIGLCSGILGGVYAQRRDFQTQKQRLLKILPFSIVGGIVGGLILLNTRENSFRAIIPFLILTATCLLAIQVPIKNWVVARIGKAHHGRANNMVMFLLVFLAAIYGGYFGAGLGVILMAVLGLVIYDSLTRLNVLKQAISFSVNIAAAIYFSFSGKVDWSIAGVMAIGSVCGGLIGGRLAGKIKPDILRRIVVLIGLAVSVYYFIQYYV